MYYFKLSMAPAFVTNLRQRGINYNGTCTCSLLRLVRQENKPSQREKEQQGACLLLYLKELLFCGYGIMCLQLENTLKKFSHLRKY
jgi:hypothetical protein